MGHRQERERARPTYSAALEAIGRYFDQQLCRGIFLAEIDEGYVGKAYPVEQETELQADGFTFPHDDILALIASPAATGTVTGEGSGYCPYPYSLFMQAVGAMCDHVGASHVSVLEITSGFVLAFTAPSRDSHKPERRRYVLDRVGIEELIVHAGQRIPL